MSGIRSREVGDPITLRAVTFGVHRRFQPFLLIHRSTILDPLTHGEGVFLEIIKVANFLTERPTGQRI